MIKRVGLWLRTVFFRRRLEREMREEMSSHLERSMERLRARGMTAEEAKRAARREFGNVEYIQEQGRDARGARGVESVLADLSYGFRQLRHTPLTTATMVALLALGIGFSSALFTVLYSLFYMPPPGITYDESLVRIRGAERSAWGYTVGREFSYPEYREYTSQTSLFSAVTAWTSSDVVLDAGTAQESLHSGAATYVTSNYFAVLGVRPVLGTALPAEPADNGGPDLVGVISHVVWERHYGRAPDVIGRSIKVNDVAVTIVGVAPRRFAGTRRGGSQVRVWLPLNARPLLQRTSASALASYDSLLFGLAARLRPGAQASQANPTVAAISARSAQASTRWRSGNALSADVVTLLGDNYFPPSGETPSIVGRVTSLIIPLLILVITCMNVSTLLLGLAAARRREIAVRLSLGAARQRIVRQLVTESVLLALIASSFALFVVWILIKTIGATVAGIQFVLDWRVFAFTFGVAILTGITFGVSPALHATRLAVSDVLKDSAGTVVAARSRLQAGLVTLQITLSQPVLLALGAIVLNMQRDFQGRPASPFSEQIIEASFNTNPRYGAIDEERANTLRRLESRFASHPGVVATVPLEIGGGYFEAVVHPADRVTGVEYGTLLRISTQPVPPGYFALMGIPVVRGRDLLDAGREESSAVVIGSDVARQLWGAADPIGRRFINASAAGRDSTLFVVAGIVEERIAGRSALGANTLRIFVPSAAGVIGRMLIRTRGPAEPMIPVIRSIANAEAPRVPLTGSRTLAAIEASERTTISRAITAATGSGLLALFLSAIGLYAVVAFAVGQRVREIGIRTALGADRRQVVRFFLARGLRVSLTGVLLGLILSMVVTRIVALAENDDPPGIFLIGALISAIATSVALIATWLPARRAARINPLDALRTE